MKQNALIRKVAQQVDAKQHAKKMIEVGVERDATEGGFFPQVSTNLTALAEKRTRIVDMGSLSKETRDQGDLEQSTIIE